MTPEEVTTMKLSRTDLVKACSAALLDELEQERRESQRAVRIARAAFDKEVRVTVQLEYGGFLHKCLNSCEGRSARLETKVCVELIPGEDIPAHALVIVQDGTAYDCNFRVQLSVPLTGRLLAHAEKVIAAQVHLAEVTAASTRKTDMDAKARLKLVAEALDSTPEGREALDALSRMRKALKK